MSEAVEKFFGVKDGRLENLDSSDKQPWLKIFNLLLPGLRGKTKKRALLHDC